MEIENPCITCENYEVDGCYCHIYDRDKIKCIKYNNYLRESEEQARQKKFLKYPSCPCKNCNNWNWVYGRCLDVQKDCISYLNWYSGMFR